MATIFNISKLISEIIHGDDLEDFDAPVKLIAPDGSEYLITDVTLETVEETSEQIVWLKGVEE